MTANTNVSPMARERWQHQTCPHCRRDCTVEPEWRHLAGERGQKGFYALTFLCPNGECGKPFVYLVEGRVARGPLSRGAVLATIAHYRLVEPPGAARPRAPKQAPKELAQDYNEACLVLPWSAKASAALSRRCLQHLVREHAGVKPRNLSDEIQEVLDTGNLPAHLREAVDGIRQYGNFATHPIKSEKTGEIIQVEPGEAEWTLDVLEGLFDFYFVHPAELQEKRKKLESKLKESRRGKLKK